MLQDDGPVVVQSLEGLPVFSLKHHLQLLPASLHGVSLFGIDVEGLQEVDGPGVENLPVLQLLGGHEAKFGSLPVCSTAVECHIDGDKVWGQTGTCLR